MSIQLLSKDEAVEIAMQAATIAAEQTRVNYDVVPDVMTLPQLYKFLNTTAPTVQKNIKLKNLPVSYALGASSPRFIKKDID